MVMCRRDGGTRIQVCFRDELDNLVEEEDGGWICFLGGNNSSGTKKFRGSNNSDGGNTEDGGKMTGEVIGSGDRIGGNNSSGTKKYRGSNNSDGGNTEDGGKMTGEVIGSGDRIVFPSSKLYGESDFTITNVSVFVTAMGPSPIEISKGISLKGHDGSPEKPTRGVFDSTRRDLVDGLVLKSNVCVLLYTNFPHL
nr:hypothetical protein [Tanacetum cinerariifolium]